MKTERQADGEEVKQSDRLQRRQNQRQEDKKIDAQKNRQKER